MPWAYWTILALKQQQQLRPPCARSLALQARNHVGGSDIRGGGGVRCELTGRADFAEPQELADTPSE